MVKVPSFHIIITPYQQQVENSISFLLNRCMFGEKISLVLFEEISALITVPNNCVWYCAGKAESAK